MSDVNAWLGLQGHDFDPDPLTLWATVMNPPAYPGIERDDPWQAALLRGYNLARKHVKALLETEQKEGADA